VGTSDVSAQYETPREASSDRRGRLSTSESKFHRSRPEIASTANTFPVAVLKYKLLPMRMGVASNVRSAELAKPSPSSLVWNVHAVCSRMTFSGVISDAVE